MFERYTEQSRRAVFFARYLAGHQKAASITTAHLLMGLAWEEDSRASEIGSLQKQKVRFYEMFAVSLPFTKASKHQMQGDMPLENNSKKALACAAQEAELDGEYWLDTDHLLRGLLRFPNEAANALESLSINLDDLRAASRRHRLEFPPQRFAALRRVRKWKRAGKKFLVELAVIALVFVLSQLLLQWLN
jgi:ATP-dependent Clp protease ATP-binding subunit ClpA